MTESDVAFEAFRAAVLQAAKKEKQEELKKRLLRGKSRFEIIDYFVRTTCYGKFVFKRNWHKIKTKGVLQFYKTSYVSKDEYRQCKERVKKSIPQE